MGGCRSRSVLQAAGRGPEGACLKESRDARRCSSHKTRSRVESFVWVNSCLPCSFEGNTPSPVCPASLLTLLSASRCSGEQGLGRFNSLSLGQGLAKEDPFPCLSPPCFPALQLLHALWCSPLPPPWSWAPVVPMWWDHTGAGLEQGWTDVSLALESRQLPLLWQAGGSGGMISYLPPSSCLESCWWEVGPGVGPPVLVRALCPPVPFSWSSWALNPPRSEPTPFPPALSTTASFRDCCQNFVPPASPERGVLGAGVGS